MLRILVFVLTLLGLGAQDLRVMSFNVRYPSKDDGPDLWALRRDMLVDTIRQNNPDIVGTQELFYEQGQYIVEKLPQYAWFGLSRRGNHEDEHMGVFYLKDKLTVVESGNYWLSETPDQPGTSAWNMSLPRMATWAVFQTRDGRRFNYVNTHFPHRGIDEEARRQCAKVIASRLPVSGPLILTGDFNADAKGGAYATLAPLLDDAHSGAVQKSGPYGTFHGFKGTPGQARIDWILYRGAWRVSHVDTITRNDNGRYPSDHFPVMAVFEDDKQFKASTLATDLKGGYQIVPADLNGDGKPDLIALASGMTELVWFENPGWERHVLAAPVERAINLAVADVEGDKIPEVLLAAGFQQDPTRSTGKVFLLRHGSDVRQPWVMKEIDALTTSHRIRAARVAGQSKPVFVNAPLLAADAVGPEFARETPLVFYSPTDWKRNEIKPGNQGVVHGLEVMDWDGDGRDELLVASFEGVYRYSQARGGQWKRQLLVRGDPSPAPQSGASEITVAKVQGRRILATVEPWHGNQVVVYTGQDEVWKRSVIDSRDTDIHSLKAGDVDGDGNDELVAAVRGPGRRVVVYASKADGSWSRRILDEGGIAAASCAIADLNGDQRSDIACIGSATANLKIYLNQGAVTAVAPGASR